MVPSVWILLLRVLNLLSCPTSTGQLLMDPDRWTRQLCSFCTLEMAEAKKNGVTCFRIFSAKQSKPSKIKWFPFLAEGVKDSRLELFVKMLWIAACAFSGYRFSLDALAPEWMGAKAAGWPHGSWWSKGTWEDGQKLWLFFASCQDRSDVGIRCILWGTSTSPIKKISTDKHPIDTVADKCCLFPGVYAMEQRQSHMIHHDTLGCSWTS